MFRQHTNVATAFSFPKTQTSKSGKHRGMSSKSIRMRDERRKSLLANLERYCVTEERYNTLLNAGICNELLECMYLYGFDLNSDKVYKVKRIVDADRRIQKNRKWRWFTRLCCCGCFSHK
jgi:hypothetical protein